jgi:ribose transport system ATP-binding protein
MEPQTSDLVRMVNISKNFGGQKALESCSFSARAGEVHALMGENGAGKSTLIKILAGAHSKDSGEIYLGGNKVSLANPRSAHELGIAVIYQEFALAPHLTVAENIFIDNLGSGKRIVNWKTLKKHAGDMLHQLGFSNIDVSKPVAELSVAYQQVVEICKALSRRSKVLVLDEPTAVLSSNEVEQLFRLIKDLRNNGVCIIYISHRIEEVFRICDRISVLKDGRNVDTVNVKDIDENRLVTMMIGRSMKEFFPKRNTRLGEIVFRAEHITAGSAVQDVSFDVRAGEILGVSGLVGAGRTETMRAIFGADKKDGGRVYLHGKPLSVSSPKKAVRQGLGMLPEDRKRHGVLLEMSVRVNGTLSTLKDFSGALGWIRNRKEIAAIEGLVTTLSVKTPSIRINASSLSGGNQQKVALMKWLASGSTVLILDEPTRGVDVGAKVEIYKVINKLAEDGLAIVMISSEMTEIIGMSDRAIVMREGRVMGELTKENITEYNLIKYAMGGLSDG